MTINFTVKNIQKIDIPDLNNIIDSVGWGVRSVEAWEKIIDNSFYFIGIEINEKMIGIGRILTDGYMCVIYDVAVNPEYQEQGVASEIMQQILKKIEEDKLVSVRLFYWDQDPELIKFYQKFGFKSIANGMTLKRNN